MPATNAHRGTVGPDGGADIGGADIPVCHDAGRQECLPDPFVNCSPGVVCRCFAARPGFGRVSSHAGAIALGLVLAAIVALAAGCRVTQLLPKRPIEQFAARSELADILVEKTQKILALVSIKHNASIVEFVSPDERRTFDPDAFVEHTFGVPSDQLEIHYVNFAEGARFDKDATAAEVPVEVHMRDLRDDKPGRKQRIIIHWHRVDESWFIAS